jgi:hypothetical protein
LHEDPKSQRIVPAFQKSLFRNGENRPMMNPSAYRHEEERYDAAKTAHIRHEREQRSAAKKRCLCTREVLPSGCILYRMTSQNEPQ